MLLYRAMMDGRTLFRRLTWLLGYVAFFGILFAPLLFLDFIFANKDIRTLVYPLVSLLDQRLWTGDALWNNLNGFGFPSFLTDGYVWNPVLTFFLTFLSAFDATHWTVAVSLILGGWFCMILFRQWGFSREASFLTGLVFALSLWPWILNPSVALIALAIPPLVLLLIREKIKPFIRYPAGVLLMSMLLLSGFPHYTVIALLAVGITVVACGSTIDRRLWRVPVVKRFSIIVLVSGCIGLLRFIPILAYSALSMRTDDSMLTTLGTIGWNLPFHLLFTEPRTPHIGGSVEVMAFIGLLPLICVLVAIAAHRKRPLVKFCLGVIGVSLLLAAAPMLLRPLLLHLPLYTALGAPSRWIFLGKLATLPLIALGFDSLIKGIPKTYQRIIALLCLTPLGLLAASWKIAPMKTKTFMIAWNLDFASNIMTLFVAVLVGLILLPSLWKHLHKLQPRILVITGAMTLFLAYAPLMQNWLTPRSSLRLPNLAPDPSNYTQILSPFMSLKYSKQFFETGETLSSIIGLLTSVSSALLEPNQNIFLELPTADIYEPLHTRRVGYLLAAVGSEKLRIPAEDALAANDALRDEEKVALFQKRHFVLDALGITHLLINFELDPKQFEELATSSVTGIIYSKRTGIPLQEVIIPRIAYYNPTAHPLTYLAEQIAFRKPNADRVYRDMLAEPWPSNRTFVECEGCEGTFIPSKQGTLKLLQYAPTAFVLQTHAAGEQWLILLKNYLPGWKVLVDQKEVEPALAQSLFFAIPLSPGDHRVTLRFSYAILLRDSIALLLAPEKSIWLR
ncbi:YfhO family protein [Candidatus Peregrinibacteria bacterium]|nr:YfhO family protein [Candidatus Peregrinibacteria bacterium]